MVVLTNFCFWCSTRLGTIIIGIFHFIQSLAWSILCIVSLNYTEKVTEVLDDFRNKLSITNRYVIEVVQGK